MNSARCARPACPGKPAAWLAYDYDARCAWIDDQPTATADLVHVWPLCERHADNLRVPRGWFCVDRRMSRGVPEDAGHEASPGTTDDKVPAEAVPDGPAGDDGPSGPSGGPAPAGGRSSAIL